MDFLPWLGRNITTWTFWFQPAFYTAHGWIATEMALWLLFHPYEPKYVPGTRLQIPFTPGIFPRGRHKLSRAIADTITDILLTQEDIKRQAEKLITEDNIYKTLDMLGDSIGRELRDIQNLRRLYKSAELFLPPLLQKLIDDAILSLDPERVGPLDTVIDSLINRSLPHLTLSEPQARWIVQLLREQVITPKVLRQLLMDALTKDTIVIIEETVRGRVSGVTGFLMRFVDIQKGMLQFRQFMMDEPEEAETLLTDLLTRMELDEKLVALLVKISPQQLPLETLNELKRGLSKTVKRYLLDNRADITAGLGQLGSEATHALLGRLLHFNAGPLADKWVPELKRELTHVAFTYLNKELETMLGRALPVISLNTVIVEKIDQFSAKELEETIQKICSRELRWLAFLGAFLGFWLGLVSNVLSYWLHPLGG